jgi:putative ABC transport system permease protein
VREIEAVWRSVLPAHEMERVFVADALDALYAGERRQLRLVGVFAGLAVLLSCLGLLAMSAFAAQRRARELAIRRVLGARTSHLLALLGWELLRPVAAGALVALPVSWWAMRLWLDGFSSRIDLGPAPFLLAAFAAFAIALATVAAQALKAARAAPVQALRYE